MCRTITSLLSSAICATQMLVRVFMTITLMLENLIRLVLQTLYNFVSFVLQLISLLPICCVFLVTSRLKCFMCGGGGPCPVNRGGGCDCLMSVIAIIILFFIFRATGILDKIFYSMGYAKAPTDVARFIPTPGDITECSRNDTEITEYELDYETTTPITVGFPGDSSEGGVGDNSPNFPGGDGDSASDVNSGSGGDKSSEHPPGGHSGGDVGGDSGGGEIIDAEGDSKGQGGGDERGDTEGDSGISGGGDGVGDGENVVGGESGADYNRLLRISIPLGIRRSSTSSYHSRVLKRVNNGADNQNTVIEESVLGDTITPNIRRKRRTPDFKNIFNEVMMYLN